MRFRLSSESPGAFDRPLQWRLLGGVAIVAALLFAVHVFRLSQMPRDRTANGARSPDLVDFAVNSEPNGRLVQGEFRSTPEARPRPFREGPREPTAAELERSLLETVRDNTLGVRREEADAFFAVLDRVQEAPAAELEQAAARDVLYVNLMTEPDKFRGRVVTIVGDMWRCYELPESPARPRGERLYEAWVFTSDSGAHPYRVVAAGLGDGLKVGDRQRTPVQVTGYFFKREGYDTPGGLHVAPTVLAKTLSRYQSPQAPPPADDFTPILLGVLAAVGLILAATFLSFAWSDRRTSRRTEPQRSLRELSAMPETDDRSVGEMLRELSERERFGESWSSVRVTHPVRAEGNGHAACGDTVDSPTPLPPTR